jgi:type IV secretion system protein VirD4
VAVFFQNVGQMKNRYPEDQWQEIIGSCDSTVFLGCTDILTAEYFSDRIGEATVEVEGTMRELNTMHITNYTPRFRRTNSIGKRQLLTPDEVLRLPPDEELVFIRGQKVFRAKRFDYSLHSEYKKLKSSKAILHEPDWKTSRVSLPREQVPDAIPVAPAPAQKKQTDSVKQKPPSTVSEPILGRKSDLSEIL